MEGYLGEVRLFAGNFAPRGWAFCDGTLLSISEYDVLFTIIGTIYGGNGQTSFALPNLCSRVAVGAGQSPGLPNVDLGEMAGTESISMTTAQMPAHTHFASAAVSIPAYSGSDTGGSPTGTVLAGLTGAYSTEMADSHLATESSNATIMVAGVGVPFSILQPYAASNYIICIEGIYPSKP
jgi:microcystin-dependent protein